MHTLLETAKFSRTYLARYWPRFSLGILLAFLFGISNSLFMGSVWTIANRLNDPVKVQQITEKGREAKAKKEEGENPALHGVKARAQAFKQEVYVLVDPWLP